MDALESGLHVMVFSDNVPVEQEIALKDAAARRGLLVMGPDCGTAVVDGVGLGFANVVRPGPIGLVAASGTGAQQLMCLLDGAGLGVRHCLGVGGRDLSAAVAGRSTRQALRMLDAEEGVELIVVVSKPPAAEVAREVEELAATLSTPVQLALLGPCQSDLTASAAEAARALGATWEQPRWWAAPEQREVGFRLLRAAYAGGTLCDEAMLVASRALGPIASNIPLPGAPRLDLDKITGVLSSTARAGGMTGVGHAMVDFGDDELTHGRPHPMIDNSLRADWLLAQAAQPDVGSLLLDVVLGHGAHPDPAGELARAIERGHEVAAAAGHDIAVVVSLCGTQADPQGLDRQAERLNSAGASVHLSNADAARTAVELLSPPG
jgi:FdrA protein